METEWEAVLSRRERHGAWRDYKVAVRIPLEVLSERNIPQMRADLDIGVSMRTLKDVTEILRKKHFRRELFQELMQRLGGKMADYLEDTEGWHGPDRQEAAIK